MIHDLLWQHAESLVPKDAGDFPDPVFENPDEDSAYYEFGYLAERPLAQRYAHVASSVHSLEYALNRHGMGILTDESVDEFQRAHAEACLAGVILWICRITFVLLVTLLVGITLLFVIRTGLGLSGADTVAYAFLGHAGAMCLLAIVATICRWWICQHWRWCQFTLDYPRLILPPGVLSLCATIRDHVPHAVVYVEVLCRRRSYAGPFVLVVSIGSMPFYVCAWTDDGDFYHPLKLVGASHE